MALEDLLGTTYSYKMDDTPDWQIAAENHNYGNGNAVSFDPSTWGTAITHAGEFAAAAVVSGFDGFVNTGVAVNNYLGGSAEKIDTAVQLAGIDSDLGKYYLENKQYIDTAGYLLGSLVSGVGGIKLLNAAQKVFFAAESTGIVGANLGSATGLLNPNVDYKIAKAGAELAKTQGTFSWIEANTMKAIAAGYHQNVLESAAFEVAALSSQAASPFLDGQDTKDIVTNMLVGVVTGGIIGGTFGLPKVYSGVKKEVSEAEVLSSPFRNINELPEQAGDKFITPADRIVVRSNDLAAIPEVDQASQYAASHTSLKTDKITKLNNLIGKSIQDMSEGADTEAATNLWWSQQQLGNDNTINLFSNAKVITRAGIEQATERATRLETTKALKTLDLAKITDISKAIPEGSYQYYKLYGEDFGTTSLTKPAAFDVRDTYTSSNELLKAVDRKNFRIGDGFNITESSHEDAQLNYLWADRYANISDKSIVPWHAIPLQEKALSTAGLNSLKIASADGSLITLNGKQAITEALIKNKNDVITALNKRVEGGKLPIEAAAKIANVSESYLRGEIPVNLNDAMFARQTALTGYAKQLSDAKISIPKDIDLSLQPTTIKLAYDTKPLMDIDNNKLAGMTMVAAKRKIYEKSLAPVMSEFMGDLEGRISLGNDNKILSVNRFDSSAGILSSANGDYGSMMSDAQNTGAAKYILEKKFKDASTESLTSSLYGITSKPEAAVEWSALNEKLTSLPSIDRFVVSETGTELIPSKLDSFNKAVQEGEEDLKAPVYPAGFPTSIPITNQETATLFNSRIGINDIHNARSEKLVTAQGLPFTKKSGVIIPLHPNPKDYPYHVLVVDDKIVGAGHVSMVHAANSRGLESLVSKVPPEFRVITARTSADYHEALGNYEYSRTLNENYIDSALQSAGINTQLFPITDPSLIAQRILEHAHSQDYQFATDLVSAKLDKPFAELRRLGQRYGDLEASAYSSAKDYAENIANNPYYNIVKTSLNISKMSEYPLLQGMNNILDKSFNKLGTLASSLFGSVKTPVDLDTINGIFEKAGINSAYKSAADVLLANHAAPKGELNQFIRGANGIISTLVLRTDPLNAFNNSLGSVLLQSTEYNSILRKIAASGDTTVGGLSQLAIPGTKLSVRSAGSLIAEGTKQMITGSNKEFEAYARANGWISSYHDLLRSTMDDLTLIGNENSVNLNSRLMSAASKTSEILKSAGDKLGKWTGNDFAEANNRYVSAYMMHSLTKPLVDKGLMSVDEATSYINTFVNRTQGVTLASQRPLAFQGSIGHAVGLFQSYQFNLMQQLFRYVGEGGGKDAAMLLGLQGTMYGMNGLPGFQFLNQHIVGTASGNTAHRDAYDLAYGIGGKQVGNWLLYGVPSNLLGINMYTRGDINPRNVTILPVNPLDIPIAQVTGKVLGNISNTVGNIANGGNIMQSILTGIEHNGLSRPLAGMAQIAEAGFDASGKSFSTTSQGQLLYANDLWSLANVARAVGGKSMDEAITTDAAFRSSVYTAVDAKKKKDLAETVKTTFQGGNNPTADQVINFSKEYAKIGGKSTQFNKFMLTAMKSANTPKANLISSALKNPMSQSMQQVMGGEEFDTTYVANPNQ